MLTLQDAIYQDKYLFPIYGDLVCQNYYQKNAKPLVITFSRFTSLIKVYETFHLPTEITQGINQGDIVFVLTIYG